MQKKLIARVMLACAIAAPAYSDVVLTDDHIFKNDICVGSLQCVDGETFGDIDLKVKSFLPQILLDDVSTVGHSWQISGDHADLMTDETFSIRRFPGGAFPFGIDPAATDTTLWVGPNGNIGLGTQLPDSTIHMVSTGSYPNIIFQRPNTQSNWSLGMNLFGFFLSNNSTGSTPLYIENTAPQDTVRISADGYLGVGTADPSAPLEVVSPNSFSFFRITADDASGNKSVDITYTGGPLGTGQLRYNIVDGDNQEMSLDADGNMVLDGTLTTAGPTCTGGCDRVFDADYPLPSIAEHQAAMWDAGYLPGVGPTPSHAPVNLPNKMGGILNELEHAHIFIGQQQAELERQAKELDAQRQMIMRLAERLDKLNP